MAVLDRLQSDANAALKAGDRERAGALRVVLSELQKAVKEGGDDEIAVLQRERKRRLESAEAFREGGRDELAGEAERDAELIESYLPEQISDEELQRARGRRGGRVRAPRRRRTWARSCRSSCPRCRAAPTASASAGPRRSC